jgi:small nuclear ribonucleoprotein (snRNP)-like protein
MAASTAAGVPIKLLHEAESHVVTIELKSGEAYRGILDESEETMNCQLTEGTFTNIQFSTLENNSFNWEHALMIEISSYFDDFLM